MNITRSRAGLVSVLAAAVAVFGAVQAATAGGTRMPSHVEVSASLKAQRLSGAFSAKIMPAKGYKGPLFIGTKPNAKQSFTNSTNLAGGIAAAPAILQSFFPDDLGYYGGPVVTSAQHVNVWWGEGDGSTWGNPDTYEYYLNLSNMIEVLDRYTGQAKSNGHWPNANNWWSGGSPGVLLYDSQVAATVQSLATFDRTTYGQPLNYGTMYHVFLPPGTDECFDNPAYGCYNPDGAAPGPFAFCGYHSYTTLGDGTVVLYSVEPYGSVPGCEGSGSANVANDTNNVLGHEIAETVSDPIPGTGWVGQWADNSGQENGDECAWTIIKQKLDGHTYYTQDWYSDAHHDCTNVY